MTFKEKLFGKGNYIMRKKLLAGFLAAVMMTSLTPVAMPAQEAQAAMAVVYNKKTPNANLNQKTMNMYVGGVRVNLDYNIGGRKSGIKGTWTTSNKKVATVDGYGIVKVVGNGYADIKFTYKNGNKNKTLKVRVHSRTRASGITLTHEPENTTIKPDQIVRLKSELAVNPKAQAVNKSIETTYTTYYEMYTDPSCSTPVTNSGISLNTDSGENVILTGKVPGTYYVRAIGKNTPNAKKYNVTSTPLRIDVVDAANISAVQSAANKITVTANKPIDSVLVTNSSGISMATIKQEPSADSKTVVVTLGSSLSGLFNVTANTADGTAKTTVNCQTAKVASLKVANTVAKLEAGAKNGKAANAYINYSMFDQFGNDITTDESVPYNNKFIAVFDGNKSGKVATVVSRGTIKIPLTAEQSVKGYSGTLQLIYAGDANTVGGQAIKLPENTVINIGEAAEIKSVAIGGIYKYDGKDYNCMLNSEQVSIKADDVITKAISSTTGKISLGVNGAYYLFISAQDEDGDYLTDSSKDIFTVRLDQTDEKKNTGLKLDGNEPAGNVKVGTTSYIAYPLAPGVVTSGSIDIFAFAGNSTFARLTKTIPAKLSMGQIVIRSSAVTFAGNNSIQLDASFCDASGSVITSFEQVKSLVSGETTNGTGTVLLITSGRLASDKGGSFAIIKGDDGSAKLSFIPNPAAYAIGAPTPTTVTQIYSDEAGNLKTATYSFFVTRTA